MRVLLFGLFLRRTGLMKPQSELVQLILPVFSAINFISFLSVL